MHILCICISLYFLMFCLPAPSPVSEAVPPVPHPQLTSHHSRGPVRLRARRSPQLAHRIGRQSASSIRARGRLTATRSLGWCWVICLVSCTPPPPPNAPFWWHCWSWNQTYSFCQTFCYLQTADCQQLGCVSWLFSRCPHSTLSSG